MKTNIYRRNIADEEFMLEKNTDKFLRETTEFDDNGNEILRIEYNPDGSIEQKTSREFDEQNRIISEKVFSEGEIVENKFWEYDSNGRAVKEIQKYIDGSYDTTTIIYNEDGEVTERRTTDDEGEEAGKEIMVRENGLLKQHTMYDDFGEVEADEENFYDEENRLIKKISLNLEGEKETIEITYNEHGQIYREILLNEDGKIMERNTYTYGENGLPSEIHEETTAKNNTARIMYNDNKQVTLHEVYDVAENLVNRVERKYDDQNRVVSAEVLISMPERAVRHHYMLTYEYQE
ncbi:MAG: hypothetical protein C0593_01735 [Marinilabiliales bacterium]|nr:MAG: hypothetical protein C0593_01735 [Marinilabiliales bacterium]